MFVYTPLAMSTLDSPSCLHISSLPHTSGHARHRCWFTYVRSPQATSAMRYAPLTTHPLTTHHSPTHHSPTHHSPLIIHHTLLLSMRRMRLLHRMHDALRRIVTVYQQNKSPRKTSLPKHGVFQTENGGDLFLMPPVAVHQMVALRNRIALHHLSTISSGTQARRADVRCERRVTLRRRQRPDWVVNWNTCRVALLRLAPPHHTYPHQPTTPRPTPSHPRPALPRTPLYHTTPLQPPSTHRRHHTTTHHTTTQHTNPPCPTPLHLRRRPTQHTATPHTSTTHHAPPITHHPPPTTNYPLPTTTYHPPTYYYLLPPTTDRLTTPHLRTIYYLLFTTHDLPPTQYSLLSYTYCLLIFLLPATHDTQPITYYLLLLPTTCFIPPTIYFITYCS